MTELSVQAVLRSRRQRRAGWLLTLGVALGLALWAEHPTGSTTALVVAMALVTTVSVVASRRDPAPALGPVLGGVATVVVGGGLAGLAASGSVAGLVAVVVFAAACPGLGGLGVLGGGALSGALAAAAFFAGPETDFTLAAVLGAMVVGGWAAGRHLAYREAADLLERVEQAEVSWALARRAQIDALTRLPNRLSVQAWLDEAFETTRVSETWLSVLLVDVDHFKKVNDTYGHLVGDKALGSVAGAIQSVLRQGDLAGRWGGEEFLVVLTSCAPAAVEAIAERLRRAVEDLELEDEDGRPLRLTVSVGGASFRGSEPGTATDLVREADRALYRAKEGGRNRSVLAEAVPLRP